MHRKNLETALYWGLPPLFALIIYWHSLRAWFQEDDFLWLSLLARVHSWHDLWIALFQPTVHGTWRPLSERAYFLALTWMFGTTSALPFRIVGFITQFASFALLSAITSKLTRSRLAGLLAPLLWIASDKLVRAMVWNSAMNYVCCGLFLLSAFWFFLRYIDTKRTAYLAAMWGSFILGLGSLEMTIVFPVMAAIYTWACARPYFRKTIPLFGGSALFAGLNHFLVPKQTAGQYVTHFGPDMFGTLAAYWGIALEPVNLSILTRLPAIAAPIGLAVFTVTLLGYAAYQSFRRNFLPLVFLGWFLALLLPVLPLRDHIMDYYLILPVMGLAMLGADAFSHAWRSGATWRGVAIVLLAFYMYESGLVAHRASWWYANRSWQDKALVMGVAAAHRAQPEQTILLKGIDNTLFWSAIDYDCFRLVGANSVYLAPGSESLIQVHPEIDDIRKFILPEDEVREAMSRGLLSVYVWKTNHLEGVTGQNAASASTQAASPPVASADRVDVGKPEFAGRLGISWYPIDQGFRWMPKRATVRLKTAGMGSHRLHISGYCPAALVQKGPLHVTVSMNGAAFPAVAIAQGDAPFEFEFPLPRQAPNEIEVAVEVDRAARLPQDDRELGLVFGVFEIR